ncbi:hypothetical protein AYL99_04477 [Fonsecaea erecta]|uniref:Uncharacterized protein n=1 Tax=Fonsecaea erecta TaxID=1367422 RepID=A0A178ZR12_9EURO|nr:hypothetical protein AYL99_04477 [Fonsecaea erecta]OAP62274.1 hypothetical protein AYL99_04477 [Fonsecaea erecta]
MSGKRKASVFEEDMFHLQPNTTISTTPSVTSSPLSSTSSTISSLGDTHPYDFLRVKAVPYLNSRTRKRYRDDRPDEEIIHENTLKKLYDAQRLHLDEAMPMSDVISLGEDGLPVDEADTEMTDDVPDAEIPQTAQLNQRTIDAFFGSRGGGAQSRANALDVSPNPFLSKPGTLHRQRQQVQRTCYDYWNNPNLHSIGDSAAAAR